MFSVVKNTSLAQTTFKHINVVVNNFIVVKNTSLAQTTVKHINVVMNNFSSNQAQTNKLCLKYFVSLNKFIFPALYEQMVAPFRQCEPPYGRGHSHDSGALPSPAVKSPRIWWDSRQTICFHWRNSVSGLSKTHGEIMSKSQCSLILYVI